MRCSGTETVTCCVCRTSPHSPGPISEHKHRRDGHRSVRKRFVRRNGSGTYRSVTFPVRTYDVYTNRVGTENARQTCSRPGRTNPVRSGLTWLGNRYTGVRMTRQVRLLAHSTGVLSRKNTILNCSIPSFIIIYP